MPCVFCNRFYLTEIAAGLHDLHGLGFVHRDVKPENVLIARSGHIKLVDFGSAARLGANGKVVRNIKVLSHLPQLNHESDLTCVGYRLSLSFLWVPQSTSPLKC